MARKKNKKKQNPPNLKNDEMKQVSISLNQSETISEPKILKNQTFSDSEISSSDLEEHTFTKTLELSKKQWFFLGLSKIIPHSDKCLSINIQKGEVSGPRDNVLKFCKTAINELERMKVKMLKLKYDISPDELRFQMQEQWKCQIFSAETLKKIFDKIQSHYKVQQYLGQQAEKILNKEGINKATRFLWISESLYEQAYKKILSIHRQYQQKNQNKVESADNSIQPRLKTSRSTKNVENSSFNNSQNGEDYTQILQKNVNSKRRNQQRKQEKSIQLKSSQLNFLDLLNNSSISQIKQKNQQDEEEEEIFETNIATNGRNERGTRQRPARRTIFVREYPKKIFDQTHFKNWIKHNRALRFLSKQDLQINNKFSIEEYQQITEVFIYNDEAQKYNQRMYSIDLYFNHSKVIILDHENIDLMEKTINKFCCENVWLTVSYRKIYTKQRNPKYQLLRELAKKDNTIQYMNAYKYLTHVLFAVGIMTQVLELEGEINDFLKSQKNSCRKIQIPLKFQQQINEFMRNKKLQTFVDECISNFLAKNSQKYKLIDIDHIYHELVVTLQIYGVNQKEASNYIQNLKEKLLKLIDFHCIEDEQQRLQKIFNSLEQKYLLFESKPKKFVLIASADQIKSQIETINKQIQNSFKHSVTQFIVKQKSELSFAKTFLENLKPEASNLKIRYEETQLKIVFIGPEITIDNFITKLQQFLENLKGKILSYNLYLTDQELSLIEKDKIIQKQIEQKWKITTKCNPNYSIGAIIRLMPHCKQGQSLSEKTIIFQKQFNIQSMPENSIFIFRDQKEVQSIKKNFIQPFKNQIRAQKRLSATEPIILKKKQQKCFYLFANKASTSKIIEVAKDCTEFFMYLTDSQGEFDIFLKEFMLCICTDRSLMAKQLKLTVVYRKNQDLKKILPFKEGKNVKKVQTSRKWYTTQNQTKIYYSEQGNLKIQNALAKNLKTVELNNEDLNLSQATHQFNPQKNTIVHLKSGVQNQIRIHLSKATFELNGVEKTVPNSEYLKIINSIRTFDKCSLSIGFYQINLLKKVQINLFSNYKRQLNYEEIQNKNFEGYDLSVNYDVETSALTLEYSEDMEENLKSSVTHIKKYLQNKICEVTIPLDKNITLEIIQQFRDMGTEQNIKAIQSKDGKNAIFKAYNEKNIDNFIKILSHFSKTQSEKNFIEFPLQWQPQNSDIQTFNVPKNSIQFINVQKAFTAGNIVELRRIQNKSVYKRFYQEKIFLKEINEGKEIKEMLLFHGTGKTDPKVIYNDKEECFNINYTSEKNLLGRGTYFAQKPEYSLSYSYHEPSYFSKIYSMFYCRVLVGDSQKCLQHNSQIKDTEFKNPEKTIHYESMTDFLNNSNIYVVYKNKRAYPLYLIRFEKK